MVAILVAVVANFILGFLWYTPLFGKAWAKELGFDMSVKPPASTLVKGMIFMVIGNFFLAYVLAHNIAAWSFVPGIDKMYIVEPDDIIFAGHPGNPEYGKKQYDTHYYGDQYEESR